MASGTSKIDPISGLPLLHLSFFLNGFAPTRFFHIECMDEREKLFESSPCQPGFDKFRCGSNREGLAIPDYYLIDTQPLETMRTDYDCLFVDKDCIVVQDMAEGFSEYTQVDDKKTSLLMDESGCNTGYVRLRKSHHWTGQAETGNWYKHSDMDEYKLLYLTETDPLFENVERHGPSNRQVHHKQDENPSSFLYDSQFTADQVYALHCDTWPKQAVDWTIRRRSSGWPSLDFAARLASNGCHFVQVAHPRSKNTEEEWRFSFSATEKDLARSLSALQRKCYVLFKLAVTHALGSSEVLSSYHLKTVMFWICEEIAATDFTGNTIGERYLDLLDKLISFLTNKHLPNYFVSQNNMISHHPPSVIEAVLLDIRKLRHSPLDVFVLFDKTNRFTSAIKRHSIEETMKTVLEDIDRIRLGEPSKSLEEVFISAFHTNIIFNIEEHMYINVLETLMWMVSLKQSTCGSDIDTQVLLEDWLRSPPVLQSTDISCSIFWQFCLNMHPMINIDEDISTSAFRDQFYSSLARYFIRRKSELEEELSAEQRTLLDERIDYAFLIAIHTLDVSPSNILDSHSWLFFDQKKFDETFIPGHHPLQELETYLQDRNNSSDIEERTTYELEDRYLIHDPLLRIEIEGAGYIRVPAAVYLHYLHSIRAAKIFGQHSDEALSTLDDMFEETLKYEGDSNNFQTLRFLGYACMYAGYFSDAFDCFQSASFLGNEFPHARMAMCICLGVLVYRNATNNDTSTVSVITRWRWDRRFGDCPAEICSMLEALTEFIQNEKTNCLAILPAKK